MKVLNRIILFLTMIGGLNWGLVGAFDFDLVRFLMASKPELENVVYMVIGLCSLYSLYLLFWEKLR